MKGFGIKYIKIVAVLNVFIDVPTEVNYFKLFVIIFVRNAFCPGPGGRWKALGEEFLPGIGTYIETIEIVGAIAFLVNATEDVYFGFHYDTGVSCSRSEHFSFTRQAEPSLKNIEYLIPELEVYDRFLEGTIN